MFRSLLLIAALALAGCSQTDSGGVTQKLGTLSLFDPIKSDPAQASAIIPFPFDGLFSGFTQPTLNIPNPTAVPFVTAANLTDGFSTTASMFTDLVGFVDYSTAGAAIVLIDSSTGQRLVPGTDFLVQPSTALDMTPPNLPINQKRSRLLIEPLHPLKPSTRYLVAVTTSLMSTDGVGAKASDLFKVVRSATPVSQQTEPVLSVLNPTQLATLEALRSSLIHPTVAGITALTGISEDQMIIAWPFTTESTTKTLQALNDTAVARTISASFTGLNTQQASGGALPPVADVWAGTITVPYYLATSGGDIHSTAPLTSYWLANPAAPDVNATFLGQVPCGAFAIGAPLPGGLTAAPSTSTTACFPMPVKQADAMIPLLMTVPNVNSGQTMPLAGWPVVIFQHGITGNRSQMLAIAPALAAAGFAVVAIDLPLHGIAASDPAAALRIAGLERTFDLDLMNNTTGAAGPDGVTDSSGSWFINLSSLATSRDNLRQAVSDLSNLTKSVGGLTNIDATRVYFVGHSLGGIVGTTFLGVNSDVRAAVLAMPGGGIAKLLDASKAFGPRISAGLAAATSAFPAANKIIEGNDNYETFERFAQQLVDSGDPINFAAAAAANHPLEVIEVINDLVVPNTALANAGTGAFDKVTISGFLSGTDPLFQEMGATVLGPITPPLSGTSLNVDFTRATDYVVQFTTGDHGSILSPAASLPTTVEMQTETANFLASDGICLPLGGSCS